MPSAVARQIRAIATDLRDEIAFPKRDDVHIVIIDDQIAMAQPMQLVCESFEISSSLIITDGADPLILPSVKNKSLIVNLDHNFPRRTGRLFLKEMREQGHFWPVGSTTAEDPRRARAYLIPFLWYRFKALLSVKPTRDPVEAYIRFNLKLLTLLGDVHHVR